MVRGGVVGGRHGLEIVCIEFMSTSSLKQKFVCARQSKKLGSRDSNRVMIASKLPSEMIVYFLAEMTRYFYAVNEYFSLACRVHDVNAVLLGKN